ncbi:Ribose 1,5-bisphosphate isomerase [uncultured archaeon]|nr:Ribose 1,5-bisphosphate isomerase [uncultured archaeon]
MEEIRGEQVLEKIRNVKIQGANEIAKAGINLFTKNPTKDFAKKIISLRPTEPLLQNSLDILVKTSKKNKTAKDLLDYIEKSKLAIAKAGSQLIKQDMNIFSHCHSTSVIEILKYAKLKQKKNFVVYTLEVEPLLQGRQTAEELAKAGIKVIVFPDLAAEEALRHCDVFFFGADAFTKKGVANKLGTELLCRLARELNIPRYSCGVSLKYTKKLKIEYRSGKEVWDERSKNIQVINPAFDFTNKKYLSGVISEFGILKFDDFVKKAKKTVNNF